MRTVGLINTKPPAKAANKDTKPPAKGETNDKK